MDLIIEKTSGVKTLLDDNKVKFETGGTFNGFCYKDEEAFKSGKGVCYISEYQYDEYRKAVGLLGSELTENEIISRELGYDRNAIIKAVENEIGYCNPLSDNIISADNDDFTDIDDDFFKCEHIKEFIDYIAECAFQEVDWQYIETYLDELDMIEQYCYFCEDKGYKCELTSVE